MQRLCEQVFMSCRYLFLRPWLASYGVTINGGGSNEPHCERFSGAAKRTQDHGHELVDRGLEQ